MAESTENTNFCEDSCVICRQGSDCDTISKVTQKGLLTLISYSEQRGEKALHDYLKMCLHAVPQKNVFVHKNCRKDYTI